VLGDALPKLLLEQVGLDAILERVRLLLHHSLLGNTMLLRLRTALLTMLSSTGPRRLPPRHLRLFPRQPLYLQHGY
jgi:hypothetical protein